jgi:hypothetical protein
MKKLTVPKFKTEAEAANWWDGHMGVFEENLVEAMKNGTVHSGGPAQVLMDRRESRSVTIRTAESDIERASKLAGRKGVAYQTFMKMLLLEALDRGEKRKAG